MQSALKSEISNLFLQEQKKQKERNIKLVLLPEFNGGFNMPKNNMIFNVSVNYHPFCWKDKHLTTVLSTVILKQDNEKKSYLIT